mmetsp:Transcript_35754/g.70437  ORF Transcript_35754/g.70437 Transcript_35754/m.70437 type:complete len:256 (-) Transcript_35754:347-1114(-)
MVLWTLGRPFERGSGKSLLSRVSVSMRVSRKTAPGTESQFRKTPSFPSGSCLQTARTQMPGSSGPPRRWRWSVRGQQPLPPSMPPGRRWGMRVGTLRRRPTRKERRGGLWKTQLPPCLQAVAPRRCSPSPPPPRQAVANPPSIQRPLLIRLLGLRAFCLISISRTKRGCPCTLLSKFPPVWPERCPSKKKRATRAAGRILPRALFREEPICPSARRSMRDTHATLAVTNGRRDATWVFTAASATTMTMPPLAVRG